MIFYYAGKQILIDPNQLYNVPKYYYLPSFAIFFAIYISIFPFIATYYISYTVNIIFGILFILEYNKILTLMNLNRKFYRFIFLIIISNGWFLYFIFTFTQTKLFVGLVLVLIMRRELQFQKGHQEKNLKYIILDYSLLIFAISMAPSFVLLLLIYLFHDIHFNEFFKKKNIKIYCIVITIFILQNFLFFIYPDLLFDFLNGFTWGVSHQETRNCFLFMIVLPDIYGTIFYIVANIILFTITSILIFNKKFHLEAKFGYFCLTYLFFGMFNCFPLFHILISVSLLLYPPYLNQKEKLIDFIRSNKLLLFSLLSVAGICLIIQEEEINRYFPIAGEYPFNILVQMRYIILFCIFGCSLIIIKTFSRKKRDITTKKTL